MIRTLVIHPRDSTTNDFTEVYNNIENCKVIRRNISTKNIKKAIKSHDRVIIIGHGTSLGLIGYNRYILDSNYVELLRENNKEVLYIWCDANIFVNTHHLIGFNTGMFISELDEAIKYDINHTIEDIIKSNILFSNSINMALLNGDTILNTLKELYIGDNNIISYNRERLFHSV